LADSMYGIKSFMQNPFRASDTAIYLLYKDEVIVNKDKAM